MEQGERINELPECIAFDFSGETVFADEVTVLKVIKRLREHTAVVKLGRSENFPSCQSGLFRAKRTNAWPRPMSAIPLLVRQEDWW